MYEAKRLIRSFRNISRRLKKLTDVRLCASLTDDPEILTVSRSGKNVYYKDSHLGPCIQENRHKSTVIKNESIATTSKRSRFF